MAVVESTKIRALREARGLLQRFGFHGFSFQQLADRLGIKKPSLYDHFKSKEELGRDLVADYHHHFVQWTETVSVFEPKDKIGALFELFFKFSCTEGKMCPLSAMIADYNSLPKALQRALLSMFETQRRWIESVIDEGKRKKVFAKARSSAELTSVILSLALGSQLVARVTEDPEHIKQVKIQALRILAP